MSVTGDNSTAYAINGGGYWRCDHCAAASSVHGENSAGIAVNSDS